MKCEHADRKYEVDGHEMCADCAIAALAIGREETIRLKQRVLEQSEALDGQRNKLSELRIELQNGLAHFKRMSFYDVIAAVVSEVVEVPSTSQDWDDDDE